MTRRLDEEELLEAFASVTSASGRPSIDRSASRPSSRFAAAGVAVVAIVAIVGVAVLGSRLPGPAVADPSTTAVADQTAVASPPSTVTPAPTTAPTPAATPLNRALDISGWSPDGRHLIVTTQEGKVIVDSSGVPVSTINGAQVAWLDSNTLAVHGDGSGGDARESVRIVDLAGTQVDEIEAEFEQILPATGHLLLAGVHPATGDLPQGDTYSIWDGSGLSEPREGHPLAWSADGSRLVVLLPNGEPGRPGMIGHIVIVDRAGNRVYFLRGWEGQSTDRYALSPDGRYLAGCLRPADQTTLGEVIVVDMESGRVENTQRECGYFDWSAEPALYVSNATEIPVKFTPGVGTEEMDFGPQTFVSAAPNGRLAVWSAAGDPVLGLIINGQRQDHVLAGEIRAAVWRSDGESVAVISAAGEGAGYELSIIVPEEVPPGPTPTPIATIDGEWRMLPPSPISVASDAEGVWTGSEFLVWGDAGLREGAAYNPATDTWRRLPDGPRGPAEYMVVIWTGEVAIAWHGGLASARNEPDGGIYDPETDTWSPISPGPLNSDYGVGVGWTGTELLVLSPDMRAAAYKPVTNSWRDLPSPPLPPGGVEADWTGSEWLVLSFGTEADVPAQLASFDPVSNTWTKLADSPMSMPNEGRGAVWDGQRWLWLGWESLVYDRLTDQWSEVDIHECPVDAASGTLVDGLLVNSSAIFDTRTGSCSDVPIPPENVVHADVRVWTGRELILWGGSAGPGDSTTTDGAAFRPTIPLQPEPEPGFANCQTVVMPDPMGELDTNLSVEEGLLDIISYGDGGEDHARVVVEFLDPACLSHPVLGPLIDSILVEALANSDDTLNCDLFRQVLESGSVGYGGEPIAAGEVDGYVNRWCFSATTPEIELFCSRVLVVEQPLGDFPRTLLWDVFASGLRGESVRWAELTLAGANDGQPVRVDNDGESGFELGLRDFGEVRVTSFMVGLVSGEVVDATQMLVDSLYGRTVRTDPDIGVPNGIYRRVFSTCPG